MTIWIVIILGLVQGLTEFLPVSSSGHLVLLQSIFGIQNNVVLFDIILHMGTLLAVIIVYRKTLFGMIKKPFQPKVFKLALATLITVIIALLFKDFFVESFDGSFLIVGFLITAVFLIIAEIITKRVKINTPLSYFNAGVMGLFQGIAMMPGISRSGSTIVSGIVQGVDKSEATDFSFLLSIPIIIGSCVFEFSNVNFSTIDMNIWFLIVGFIIAFISGLFAIKIMLRIVQKAKLYYFSIYLIILSAFLILNKYVFFLF